MADCTGSHPRIRDVVAGYGEITILNGLTSRSARGTITTVIGPNGAGKSTVFKAMFGLLKGSLRPDHARRPGHHRRRRRASMLDPGVSYVPQGRNIFPELSVRHNLELGGITLARPDATRASRGDGPLPVLREEADAQASTLSGGQQKQLEVARALLLEPKVILIDEPSIGLSPLVVQEVFRILQACATGASRS